MPFQKIKYDILGDFQTMWYDIKCIAAYKKLLKLEVLIIWNILLRFSDAPHAELRLGRSLNASNIKEGDDVYFECLIHSNPAPSTIVWTRHVSCNFIPFNLTVCQKSFFCSKIQVDENTLKKVYLNFSVKIDYFRRKKFQNIWIFALKLVRIEELVFNV